MKKVLIIANLFHSSPRIPGMVMYLKGCGWEPVILTVPLADDPRNLLGFPAGFKETIRIVQVPYKGDIFWFWRKIFKLFGFKADKSILNQTKAKTKIVGKKSLIDYIFNFYQTIFGYPDDEKTWRRPALDAANRLLKNERFDAIISSSSPVTCHIIAGQLKKKHKILWIADFRDLWTQNHNYPYFWLRKVFEKQLELKTLSLADALVVVSRLDVKKLISFHKDKKVICVFNGFNPKKINEPPANLTSKFTITYTGQIYLGKQNPVLVLTAIKELFDEGKIDKEDVEIRFFGPEQEWLDREITKLKLDNNVKQYGTIARDECIQKQWESQILLFFNWEDLKEKGVYSGKIFEYLAARRPILATGGFGSDVVENLLQETGAGIYASTIEDIKKVLQAFYLEYKQKGKIDFKGNCEKINKYSQKGMAEKFASLLSQITENEK